MINYFQLQVTDNYFTNVINIRHFSKWKMSHSYNHIQAPFSIFHQNDFVMENYNLILIPIHYIHPPFFDINYPQHVVYGRFGILVALAMLNSVGFEGQFHHLVFISSIVAFTHLLSCFLLSLSLSHSFFEFH